MYRTYLPVVGSPNYRSHSAEILQEVFLHTLYQVAARVGIHDLSNEIRQNLHQNPGPQHQTLRQCEASPRTAKIQSFLVEHASP